MRTKTTTTTTTWTGHEPRRHRRLPLRKNRSIVSARSIGENVRLAVNLVVISTGFALSLAKELYQPGHPAGLCWNLSIDTDQREEGERRTTTEVRSLAIEKRFTKPCNNHLLEREKSYMPPWAIVSNHFFLLLPPYLGHSSIYNVLWYHSHFLTILSKFTGFNE